MKGAIERETKDWYLVTCEHGGNRVPPRYRSLFAGWESRLASHRGFDRGALQMARDLARAFGAPLVASRVTRLLVDLNRSLHHPTLRSEASRRAPLADQARMVRDHYLPHRDAVERLVRDAVGRGRRVVHIASHSFTRRLRGQVRRADVGLLYDPARPGEVALCERWQAELAASAPELRVRRNYPYRGDGDGLTTHLRRLHAPAQYAGVELEVNQALVGETASAWAGIRTVIVAALQRALVPRRLTTTRGAT